MTHIRLACGITEDGSRKHCGVHSEPSRDAVPFRPCNSFPILLCIQHSSLLDRPLERWPLPGSHLGNIRKRWICKRESETTHTGSETCYDALFLYIRRLRSLLHLDFLFISINQLSDNKATASSFNLHSTLFNQLFRVQLSFTTFKMKVFAIVATLLAGSAMAAQQAAAPKPDAANAPTFGTSPSPRVIQVSPC